MDIRAPKEVKQQLRHQTLGKKHICKTEKFYVIFLNRNATETEDEKSYPHKPANNSLSIKTSEQTSRPQTLLSTIDVFIVENPSVKMTARTKSESRIELAVAVK